MIHPGEWPRDSIKYSGQENDQAYKNYITKRKPELILVLQQELLTMGAGDFLGRYGNVKDIKFDSAARVKEIIFEQKDASTKFKVASPGNSCFSTDIIGTVYRRHEYGHVCIQSLY